MNDGIGGSSQGSPHCHGRTKALANLFSYLRQSRGCMRSKSIGDKFEFSINVTRPEVSRHRGQPGGLDGRI